MDINLKHAIQKIYTELCENLSIDYVGELFSGEVITLEEKQHLDRIQNNCGDLKAARQLVDYLLEKDEDDLDKFLQFLHSKQDPLYGLLRKTEEDFQNASTTLKGALLQDIGKHLKHVYLTDSSWSAVELIPGELNVDVSHDDIFMTPVLTAERVSTPADLPPGFKLINTPYSQVSYTPMQSTDIEDIFSLTSIPDANSKSSACHSQINQFYVMCTGDPGVGKTSLMHRIITQWAKNKSYLQRYHAVFLVPARHIKHKSIEEVLTSLNLLRPVDGQKFHECLSVKENAAKVLFLFDGVDENDLCDEIIEIINGDLFNGCSVLVTARPEANRFMNSCSLKPNIKMILHGTDEKSIHRFLSNTLRDSSEARAFYDKCKQNLTNLQILSVPLYLTLLTIVFRDSIEIQPSGIVYTLPQTTTDLFNSFLVVLIKRWLKRMGITDKLNIVFDRKPLDVKSTIPCAIKRSLFFIGKLCYKGLCNNKYEFNQADIKSCLLDEKEITECGLFFKGFLTGESGYSLRHKQMQEYFAALYMSEQTDVFQTGMFFSQDSQTDSTKPLTLAEYCVGENMVRTTQFLVSFVPEFIQHIFASIRHSRCIKKSPKDGSIDIYFEASLYKEANSSAVLPEFAKYLSNLDIHEKESGFTNYLETSFLNSAMKDRFEMGNFDTYQMALESLINAFDDETAVKLLQKWYNITLQSSEHDEYELLPTKKESMSIFAKMQTTFERYLTYQDNTLHVCLDQVSALLLSKFSIKNVSGLKVRSCHVIFVHLPTLLNTFPDITSVDLLGSKFQMLHLESSLQSTNKMEESKSSATNQLSTKTVGKIESIKLTSSTSSVIAEQNVECILSQNVKSLILIRCDIFRGLSSKIIHSVFKLEELIIDLKSCQQETIDGIVCLLSHATNLKKLRLWVLSNGKINTTELVNAIKFSPMLNTLFIDFMPKVVLQSMLSEIVPNLKTLKHIGIHYRSVKDNFHQTTENLCRSGSLKTLTLYNYNHNGVKDIMNLQYDLLTRLKQHLYFYEKTPTRLLNMEDYLSFVQLW